MTTSTSGKGNGLHVVVVDGWLSGSHQAWAEGWAQRSNHRVTVLGMHGAHWRWRLQGGAVTLAQQYLAHVAKAGRPDVVIVAETIDISAFAGLCRHELGGVPLVAWFHENQLTYPTTGNQRRDPWPAWVNWRSALAADAVVLNSKYHRDDFAEAIPRLMARAPDESHDELYLDVIAKMSVLPVGADLATLVAAAASAPAKSPASPLILWNHRWDEDKDPRSFIGSLGRLAADGLAFRVALLGEDRHYVGEARADALKLLGDRVEISGYLPTDEYRAVLAEADICVSTAQHEFFGLSTVEAIAAGAIPVLPRRLSYPEILGEAGERYLYEEHRPTRRIRAVLDDFDTWAKGRDELAQTMLRFDWATVAPQYDQFVEQLSV